MNYIDRQLFNSFPLTLFCYFEAVAVGLRLLGAAVAVADKNQSYADELVCYCSVRA